MLLPWNSHASTSTAESQRIMALFGHSTIAYALPVFPETMRSGWSCRIAGHNELQKMPEEMGSYGMLCQRSDRLAGTMMRGWCCRMADHNKRQKLLGEMAASRAKQHFNPGT